MGRWLSEQRPDCADGAPVRRFAAPLLDKAWAEEAGLGWIGKHSNVIQCPGRGSWMVIWDICSPPKSLDTG